MKKKVLIFGPFGKVGEAVFQDLVFNTNWTVYAMSRYSEEKKQYWTRRHCDFDIFNFKELKKIIINLRPDVIINCAAFTNVDLCEEQKAECWKLNVDFVEALARGASIANSHLIHFSTDYIFDGLNGPYPENALPNPINFYGKSKLASENAIKSLDCRSTIIRTNFLFGFSSVGKKTFVDSVIDNLSKGNEIKVVNALFSYPLITTDIAIGVRKIIKNSYLGIINFAGNDYVSRFELAKVIASVNNLDQNLIVKADLNELDFLANRPIRAGLINQKAKNELGINFQNLEDALREYFSQQLISRQAIHSRSNYKN